MKLNWNFFRCKVSVGFLFLPFPTNPKPPFLLIRKKLSTSPLLIISMSWACKRCTFVNSSRPTCQMCLSPASSSPLPLLCREREGEGDAPRRRWPCKACTFLNLYNSRRCEICGTHHRAAPLDDLDSDCDDPSIGSVFFPLIAPSSFTTTNNKRKEEDSVPAHNDPDEKRRKLGGFQGMGESNQAVTVMKGDTSSSAHPATFKILTYNVWFNEDLEVHKRMEAIGDLILLHSPDMICFQEVTPNIYDIFRQSSWWKGYVCSVSREVAGSRSYFCMQLSKFPVKSFSTTPFSYTGMGRELCTAELEVHGKKQLVISTSHLESPCPGPPKWDQMYSKERVEQAKQAVNHLNANPNAIFCGDMNWDDKLDGQFPFTDGWVDAWVELRPGDNGWTYDTKSNQMLSANRTLQKRLDRCFCRLKDFKISNLEMVGKEAIMGLSYIKQKKVRSEIKSLKLPVLPSDHYGLLLTIIDKGDQESF